jgi:hypothetical protein
VVAAHFQAQYKMGWSIIPQGRGAKVYRFKTWVAMVFGVAFAVPAFAQDTVQHSESGFYVLTSAGVPKGCGFEFSVMYRDRTYRQGGLAGVTGSLTWLEFSDGSVGAALKLAGIDYDVTLARTTAFRVHNGFVIADRKTLLPTKTVGCDQPTAFCGVYSLANAAAIYGALGEKSLAIGFSREANGLDITLPLDPRSSIAAKPNDYQDYNACMGTLAQRGLSNLPK